jgi:hypothetical protein
LLSALIFFLGAEFTQIYTSQYGSACCLQKKLSRLAKIKLEKRCRRKGEYNKNASNLYGSGNDERVSRDFWVNSIGFLQ